ncbi:Tuberin-like, partial [Homarus americanus]
MVFKIMSNLLGTHYGDSALCILCHIIQEITDPHIVRGAIFFITSILWGSAMTPALNYTPSVVLATLYKASENSHVLVVYEVAVSIQKLVVRMGSKLHVNSWTLVLKILMNVFMHTVKMTEERIEKPTILAVLSEAVDGIEHLVESREYFGSHGQFYLLVDQYSQLRPEASVIKLLDYQEMNLNPANPLWLVKLAKLFTHHYHGDQRLKVKMKALDILSHIFKNNSQVYGTELIREVIVPQLNGVEKETEVKVRTAAVKFLCQISVTHKSDIILDVLNILEKVLLASYLKEERTVLQESEATDIVAVVDGLIQVFKVKMWEIPASHSLSAFTILLRCLDHHYQNTNLKRVSTIRYLILEMILDMRVNSHYQIGFPRLHHEDENSGREADSSMISPFSPFLILDHELNRRVKQAYMRKDQQEVEILGFSSMKHDRHVAQEIANEVNQVAEIREVAGSEISFPNYEVTSLPYTQATRRIINSLKQEKDWVVLRLILEKLPEVLKNKILVLTKGGNELDSLTSALFSLIDGKTLDVPKSLYNTPTKFTQSDFQCYVFPVLAMLVPHQVHMESTTQQKIIRILESGVINQYAGGLCISALTLCVLEMQDSMVKSLHRIILHFTKITATVPKSQAMMEFLSTVLHFPKVYSNFVADQYMAIFAIAIPYTNPIKFNHYIVSLAYHVIAMWFLKCRLPFRRGIVKFISKNLEMIQNNMTLALNMKKSSAERQTKVKGKGSGKMSKEQGSDETEQEEERIHLYSELRETCVDLMSRYSFASCSPLPKRGPVAEMLISGGPSMTWLIGNKLITITTSGCSQKALQNGLCEKCLQLCNTDKYRQDDKDLVRPSSPFSPDVEASPVKPFSEPSLDQLSDSSSACPHSELPTVHSSLESSSMHSFSETSVNPSVTKLLPSHLGPESSTTCIVTETSQTSPVSEPSSSYSISIQSPGPSTSETSPSHSVLGLSRRCSGSLSPSQFLPNTALSCLNSDLQNCRTSAPPLSHPVSGSFLSSCSTDRAKIKLVGKDDLGCPVSPSESKDDKEPGTKSPTKGLTSPLSDRLLFGSQENTAKDTNFKQKHKQHHLCACWCQGWAEIFIRQPTGNTSWMMRIQNQQTLMTSEGELPLYNLSEMYSPAVRQDPGDGLDSVFSELTREEKKEEKSVRQSSSILTVDNISGSPRVGTGVAERSGVVSPQPLRRDRGHTISDMNPASRRVLNKDSVAASKSKKIEEGISPNFVFLQLYYHGQLGDTEDRPLLLPTDRIEFQRALRVIDLIRPQETHKIGVLCVRKGQTTEQEILRNTFGSLRYMSFIMGLGKGLDLQSLSQDEVFLGGLDTKGSDGKAVFIWQDDVMQVVFHVATLMPTKNLDPNCNGKKCHIGNNYVTIVYNESGKPYDMNTIKGQFNHTVVEVVPYDHHTNTVGLLCRPELREYIGNGDPRLVSDDNLPVLVRQLALHANLASMILDSLNRPPHTLYASNWMERLRKIRKIRQTVLNDIKDNDQGLRPPQLLDFTDLTDSCVRRRTKSHSDGYSIHFLY